MPKFVADKSLCNISLRKACLSISIFFLVSLVLGFVGALIDGDLFSTSILIGFFVMLIINLALLFGVLWSNPWLVLVWLVHAALFFIGWPIAVLGVIFNFGDYRNDSSFDNVFLILFEYILALVIFGYFTYLVYSYFHQLRIRLSATPRNVVV